MLSVILLHASETLLLKVRQENSFPPLKFHPKPGQKPGPPILLGGTSKWVFKRIAAWGDGWAPWQASNDEIKAGRISLDEACAANGRDGKEVTITNFTDSVDRDVYRGFEDAGVDRVVVIMKSTPDQDPFGKLEQIAKAAGL